MQRPDRWLAMVGFELCDAAHVDASMAKKQSLFSRLGIAPFLDDLSDYKLAFGEGGRLIKSPVHRESFSDYLSSPGES